MITPLPDITLTALVIVCAYILDLILGDPFWLPHPVRLIGACIGFLEAIMRRPSRSPFALKLSGVFVASVVVVLTYVLSGALLFLTARYSTGLFMVLSIALAWTTLSARGLHMAAVAVMSELKRDDITAARYKLSAIVGRDTGTLDKDAIERALVETVSENTSDGIIAPLFFLLIGGVPLALAYKAINTMDSMLGYKNAEYIHFGWFPARLDDFVNYIPARLTAVIMVAAVFMLGLDWRSSFKILLRDGGAHPSPNAGLPEAAVAGALGMRLGGPASYGSLVVSKPYIGDPTSRYKTCPISATVRIMHLTGIIMVLLAVFVRLIF